ncbi:hypothetical protein EYC84_012049 [Monilinia fructicola]|uniref:Uncharacterized protein n=1 Tax=Monilinia fructicola TaxID=38448 RepID=A0A5M9J6I6_MONFR|nr:hypothetical protein EYC84_012049 [Monilinia fructicola]
MIWRFELTSLSWPTISSACSTLILPNTLLTSSKLPLSRARCKPGGNALNNSLDLITSGSSLAAGGIVILIVVPDQQHEVGFAQLHLQLRPQLLFASESP